MDTLDAGTAEALEARARLQLRVHRTLLRHKLIMCGNALLVGYLFAVLLVALWYAALALGAMSFMDGWQTHMPHMRGMPGPLIGLNLAGMAFFKILAALFLLCPGLGLRICGGLMKV